MEILNKLYFGNSVMQHQLYGLSLAACGFQSLAYNSSILDWWKWGYFYKFSFIFCANHCCVHNSHLQERVQLKGSFPVVICHPSGAFNLAFRMSRNGFTQVFLTSTQTSLLVIFFISSQILILIIHLYIQLQDEAALTLKCMEKCRDGGFEAVFMTKIDYAVKYDYCMR